VPPAGALREGLFGQRIALSPFLASKDLNANNILQSKPLGSTEKADRGASTGGLVYEPNCPESSSRIAGMEIQTEKIIIEKDIVLFTN